MDNQIKVPNKTYRFERVTPNKGYYGRVKRFVEN